MKKYEVTRHHIECLILSTYLNQNRTLELDKMEIEEYIIPYEIFVTTRLNKLIAKAIYNFQQEKKPVDEVLIYDYIVKKTDIDSNEYLAVESATWVTFDTMINYIKLLREIDSKDKMIERLRAIR